jgi:hypothetical protein
MEVRREGSPSSVDRYARSRNSVESAGNRDLFLITQTSQVQVLPPQPIFSGSIPITWVTVYSDDIGNTFGAKGLSIGSRRMASSSKYPKS